MQTNVTNTFSSKALFLAIPAGISIRFSKSICSSRSIFSYRVPSKFLENQSVYPHEKKTDEKQSTISSLKGYIRSARYKGNLLVKSAIVRVPVASSKREKKMKNEKNNNRVYK